MTQKYTNPRPTYPRPPAPPMPTPPNQFTTIEGRALKLAMSEANDLRLDQLAAAEGHHEDKGYMLGSQKDYEAFVARRNRSQPKQLTQEEVLHELWFLKRRVRQLERQLLQSTPYNPEADVHELAKWLNEEPNRDLNRQALARILAYLR